MELQKFWEQFTGIGFGQSNKEMKSLKNAALIIITICHQLVVYNCYVALKKMTTMRHLVLLIFILFGFISTNLIGQSVIENDNLKFWQPETKLIPSDFKYKADTSGAFGRLNRKYGMKAYSYCILKSTLDVPKKKRERGKKLEKVYFAPCIDKNQSVSITTDSFELEKQKIYFDITELYARIARKQLELLSDSLKNTYGIYWTFYSSIVSKICGERNEMYDAYTNDVFLMKKDGYYQKWRVLVDDRLNELNKYATKPEDCLRFLNGKPLTDDYIKSPDYLGEIKCHK
jgi:hypothetical protein